MYRDAVNIPSYWVVIVIVFIAVVVGIKKNVVIPPGYIHFRDTAFNFGSIPEGAIVSHQFRFTNHDTVPASITSFHASCGCTTSDYDPQPVQPGDTGHITVVFNSDGLPGPFNKEAVITTDVRPYTVRLHISGTVLPGPLVGKDVVTMGHVRFSPGEMRFNSGNKDEPRTITVQNAGARPVHITGLYSPVFLNVRYPDFALLTGEKINIPVNISPAGIPSFTGTKEDSIVFYTDDSSRPVKKVRITIFNSHSPAKDGPLIRFEKKIINAGHAIENQVVRVRYRLTNNGNEPLRIYDLIPSCGCTTAHIDKNVINPGEQAVVSVVMDTHGKTGRIQKEILVRSNAVNAPGFKLILKVKVQNHPAPGQIMNDNQGNIFTGNCRSCHYDPAHGKTGALLYGSICQTCHGPAAVDDGLFHPGRQLNVSFLESKSPSELFKLIAWGTPDSMRISMMPGFIDRAGGPLSKNQVNSLVKYLKSTVRNH